MKTINILIVIGIIILIIFLFGIETNNQLNNINQIEIQEEHTKEDLSLRYKLINEFNNIILDKETKEYLEESEKRLQQIQENTNYLLTLDRDCIKEKCVNLCNNLNEKASQIDFNTNKGKVFCKCGFEILEDKSNFYELNNQDDCKGEN